MLIRVSAPPTVSLDFTQTQMQKIEDLVQPLVKSGEVKSIFSVSGFGSNTSSGFMTLTPRTVGPALAQPAADRRTGDQLLQQVPGVQANIIQSNSLGIRGGGNGLQFAVSGSDYNELNDTAQKIAAEMNKDPKFGRVTVNYNATTPELTVSVDRDKAAALGVDINGLATTMQAMIDGTQVGQVFVGDAAYPVRIVSTIQPVNDPSDLENIFVKTQQRPLRADVLDRLAQGSAARPAAQPRAAAPRRFGHRHARWLRARRRLQPRARRSRRRCCTNGDTILPLAEAKTIGESNNGLAITFGFAVLVILLVLSAQFESVFAAIIVMITVPFGLACAIYAVLFTGGSLNIYSQIGLIMVVGIMAKNGILIVEFANQLRDRGFSVREAIEQSANIRLRPVLMTMIATVLGGVPLVISTGAGAEARRRWAGSSSAASASRRSRRCC